ncbi:MAG: hypothetical protein PVI26_02060 [Chitinispirillia bacterium]|jgi:hypothetical protein
MDKCNIKNSGVSVKIPGLLIVFINIFFYILFIKSNSSSTQLATGSNSYGFPFIVYNEPSAICKQNGLPVGLSFNYNINSDDYSFIAGFSETFTRSAYALAYSYNNYGFLNRLTTAVSFPYKTLTFGASFNFIFRKSEPLFAADGGARLYFSEEKYIGINFKNIIFNDTAGNVNYRGITLSTGGDFHWLKELYYNVQAIFNIYNFIDFNYWNYEYGYGGKVNIEKYFLNNPSFSFLLNGEILFNNKNQIELNIANSFGFHYSFNKFAMGIYCGCIYSQEPQRINIASSIYVNPLYIKEVPMLSCNITLFLPYFTPDGDGEADNAIIHFKGCFSNKKVRTKKWTVLVSRGNTTKSEIVKVFTGGNIPPSTILWNGRDSKGDLLKEGEYYIHLILIDTMDRIVRSKYKEVELR